MASAETRVSDRVDGQVNDLQSQIEANQTKISSNEKGIERASKTAQDALDRALAAGKLAEGKFLYETVLSNSDVRFDFEKAGLSEEAMAALNSFANGLKQQNKNVYVEIQGHTDSTGADEYNDKLGLDRAEAVRRYLSKQGLALHRMSVISYGESEPTAENDSREGRAENRRVVLVVLQ